MSERLKTLSTMAAGWLLGLIWGLPLLYAIWAAVHPSAFSTSFHIAAPLTWEIATLIVPPV